MFAVFLFVSIQAVWLQQLGSVRCFACALQSKNRAYKLHGSLSIQQLATCHFQLIKAESSIIAGELIKEKTVEMKSEVAVQVLPKW